MARKGLPKWAIAEARKRGAKNIFAYAWSLVKRKRSPKRKSNPGGKKKVARKSRRRRAGLTIPLAPVIGLGVGVVPAVQKAMQSNWEGAVHDLALNYLGYSTIDGKFHFEHLSKGLYPLILGVLIHKFVGGSPLNFNRLLARAKIPLIRI